MPLSRRATTATGCAIMIVVVGLPVFIIGSLVKACASDIAASNATSGAGTTDPDLDFRVAKQYAEGQVKSILKDPDTATFRNEIVKNPKLPMVCGEVNARNSFGGMTGFTPYIVVGSAAQLYEGEQMASFRHSWNTLCAGEAPKRKGHHPRLSKSG